MSMPDFVLYEGIARDVVIELTAGTFDFTAWDDIKVVSTGLGFSKTLGAAEISSVAASSITLHALAADTTSKTHTFYRYQLLVETGSVWYSVTRAEARIEVRGAA